MWGFGGKYYWGRRETGQNVQGLVVIYAWMSSEEKHVKSYVDLFASLGWNSLVCHSQFLNMFFPEKGASLASELLHELAEELKVRPCPVVFASFSGGPKACMCKVLQDEYQLVRDCISGQIFYSTPVDLTTDMGHYKRYPVDYKAAVTELLEKAAVIYFRRIRLLDEEKIGLDGKQDEVPESLGHLGDATMSSSQAFQRRVALELNDHFFVPSSSEYHGDEVVGSAHDEYKARYIPLTKPPVINAHGILGQALFGLCVPEDVDDWDIKPSPFLKKSPFNPVKCIRCSKL